MADTSQLLAFRPRCRPPAPSAVNSWAVVNINVHLEQTAHQAAVVNFTHLRNALIDARHVLGEPEVVDGDGSGLFPAGAGRGDHAWRMPQPTPGPSPVVGMPAPESAHLPSMQKRLPAGPHHGRAAQTTTPPNLGGLNSRNQLEGQLNMSPSGTHVGTHSALKQLLVAETKQLERPSNTPSVMPASEVRRPSHQQHFEQRAQPPASRPAAAPPITRRRGLGLQAAPSSEWDLEFDQDLLEGLDGEMEMNPDGERTRPSHDPNSSTGQVARETADPSRRQEGHHQQQQRDYQQQWPLHKSVTVAAGSAGRQPADVGRRNSGELKQAVLVPGGRCALPPPPQLGEAWKAARPGGRVIAASTIAVEQQHQQRCVRSSASLQGQAQGTQAALGATARGKRPRGDEHGDEAAPLPPRGGGVDGKCAKKKAGGKDADGEAAEALLLPQLQLLCEALEGPEVGSGAAAVREVSELGVASELRGDISRSHLLLAGLLVAVSEGPVYQFASNMQSVSKPQREMLLKARRLLAKHPAASAAFNVREEAPGAAATAGEHGGSSSLHTDVEGSRSESRSRLGSGVQASEHLERCVGFCVMCLDERMCKELLGDSRGCSAITIGGGTIEAVGSAAGGDATGGGGGGGPGCVKMYLLPTALWPPPEARPAPWSGLGGRASAGSSGPQSLPPTAGPRLSHPTLLSLLDDVLVRAPCPVLCCNAKALLREAMSQGWRSPPPQQLRLIDPCVLAWMEAPQLAQRDEKEIEGYSIDTLCPRYGISLQPPQNRNAASCSAVTGLPSPPLAEGPLARLRRSLLATAKLFEAVRVRVQPWLRPQAVQVEMQVMAVLARMEALGIAVDAADLSRKAAAVRRRMEALSATASALLGGRPLNLGSSVQLAGVLYEELKLPPPVPQGQRDAATGPGKDRNGRLRTHHSTDEAALKQISHLHPLPALVLQYRSLQNVLSKWLEPEWLPPLLARSGTARAVALAIPSRTREALPRLSCCWNQTATATGRLSSSAPNMQAVTRYEVMVQIEDEDAAAATAGTAKVLEIPIAGGTTGSADGAAGRKPSGGGNGIEMEARQQGGRSIAIVARNAFVAPAGRLLVAADYSQIELRLLAHLSGDLRLQELLKMGQNRSGGADAFRLIAAAWLRPGTAAADISSRDREQVKRVIYGIIYGMTPQGLAQQLAEHGVGLEEAVALRASFLRHFGGVQAFITSSLHQARRQGYVTTGILGRRRPITGVTSTDPRVRVEAERKVVNSIVQGSAADLVKCAMCMWAASNHPDAQQAAILPTCKNRDQAPGRGRDPTTGIGKAQLSTAALISSHIPVELAARAPPAPANPSATGGGTAVSVNIDAELVAQIHDELIFEVDARPEVVRRLVVAVRAIMCDAVALKVPLLIKVAAGQRWGELQELPADFGEETS